MHGWWLASYLILWALVLVLGVFCLATLRQLGLLYVRLGGSLGALQTGEGPEIGAEIPVTKVHEPSGIVRSLIPPTGQLRLLLFMSPTCEICDPMIPELPGFARAIRRDADLVVLMSAEDRGGKLAGWRAGEPPVVTEPSLGEVFGVPSYPYGVVVDDRGRVGSKGLVNDLIQLDSLLNEAEHQVHDGPANGNGHGRPVEVAGAGGTDG